jgi:hypothetical protein
MGDGIKHLGNKEKRKNLRNVTPELFLIGSIDVI